MRNGNLLYTIHPIQLMLGQFYEHKLARADTAVDRQRDTKVLALHSDREYSE